MNRVRFDQDIQPLSEFRAGMSSFINQINETHRPLILTQRGKGVAVVLDVSEYEAMQEKIELLEEVQQAELEILNGAGLSNQDAKNAIFEHLAK